MKAGYDLSAEAILLAESDGTPEEVADQIAEIERVVRDSGATALVSPTRKPNACGFGPDAKMPFPPPAACRPITTVWTAPFRARISGRC